MLILSKIELPLNLWYQQSLPSMGQEKQSPHARICLLVAARLEAPYAKWKWTERRIMKNDSLWVWVNQKPGDPTCLASHNISKCFGVSSGRQGGDYLKLLHRGWSTNHLMIPTILFCSFPPQPLLYIYTSSTHIILFDNSLAPHTTLHYTSSTHIILFDNSLAPHTTLHYTSSTHITLFDNSLAPHTTLHYTSITHTILFDNSLSLLLPRHGHSNLFHLLQVVLAVIMLLSLELGV